MKRASSIGDVQVVDGDPGDYGGTVPSSGGSSKRARKLSKSSVTASARSTRGTSRGRQLTDLEAAEAAMEASDQINLANETEIKSLKSEVAILKKSVSELTARLSFVLSLLGVDDNGSAEIPVDNDEFPALQHPPTTPATQRGASAQHKLATKPGQMSYSQALRVQLGDDICKEVLSAVHIEMDIKSKRSNCVVVQGVSRSNGVAGTDLDHIRDFLSVEFPDRPVKVESCKRLGQESQGQGRIQPLLVVMETSEQAKYIINTAARLRHSPIAYTRNNIFIGPFLTKAESRAAYELRCKRRAQRAARQSGSRQHSAATASAASAVAADDVITRGAAATHLSATVTVQQLNPDAQSFLHHADLSGHASVSASSDDPANGRLRT